MSTFLSSTCDNCRWWDGVDKLHALPHQCRRHAPPSDVMLWPETQHFDWCGDFEIDPRKVQPGYYFDWENPEFMKKMNALQAECENQLEAIQVVEWPGGKP